MYLTSAKVISLSNTESIKKYGLLNYVEEIDADTKVDYKKIVSEKLKELCIVKNTISLNFIADYNMRVGIMNTINNDIMKIHGDYKILTSNHAIRGTEEDVTITIQEVIYPA